MFRLFLLSPALLLLAAPRPAAPPATTGSPAPPPLKAVILDGQNNHDWRKTTPVLRKALERSGRFTVAVATSPPTSDAAAWESFRVDFAAYDLVVSNFTDFGARHAPERFVGGLTKWVQDGGALAVVHAATSGFDPYPEYARMVGLGWRKAEAGDRVALDKAGQLVRLPKGKGPGTVHHEPYATVVQFRGEHPIHAGLNREWWHLRDEIWYAPRGPAENLTILGTIFSHTTDLHEPVLWTVQYGKGRVFVTLLGHDVAAMRCFGFQTTLCRGAEWAATGKVTQPVPARFPEYGMGASVDESGKVTPEPRK